jgi:hypothetical protein
MECYTIRLMDETEDACCPKCGKQYRGLCGLGLFTKEHEHPVCRSCARKCSPTMAALLDLAVTAERVGKSCRHLLTPPMESLLDLAHAAENYSHTAPKLRAG